MFGKRLVLLLPGLLAALSLLAACSPTLSPSENTSPLGTPTAGEPEPTSTPVLAEEPTATPGVPTAQSTGIPEEAAEAVGLARQDLAQRLGIAAETIAVTAVRAVDWPDTSLGCPEPGKMYAQVITPGYEIILEADGEAYAYHSGGPNVIYCEDPNTDIQPTPAITGTQPALDPAVAALVEIARQDLAQTLGIAPESISVASVSAVEWRDSSVGCPQPGMNYLTVITPGYLILLEADGQTYEYHTDQNQVVTCEDPQPPLTTE